MSKLIGKQLQKEFEQTGGFQDHDLVIKKVERLSKRHVIDEKRTPTWEKRMYHVICSWCNAFPRDHIIK